MTWAFQEGYERQRIDEQAANIAAAQNLPPHVG